MKVSTHEVQVLHPFDPEETTFDPNSGFLDDYPLTQNHIHTKQVYVELKSDFEENDIRQTIISVIRKRIANL